ncbi:MaoC/PaaZ C-terminal domain-containing protein [Conexibacter sp. S30A1]|uniref:MaoC family dehydratase n=1 Tax=Conexibacter sp. S30A1 TaxID=2937800 RepID=UPI00200CF749|nr:MaoC/PaaZ C-terminal domain-containing protein [Conexibacter sp. S30A1]
MPGWTCCERYFEDYSVGERFAGPRKTVDQADVSAFAGLTWDFHPAHTDESFATERYGGRIAHGMLTFSIVTGLTVEYNLLAISYGYEKVRFPHPVRPGDTIAAAAEVKAKREHRRPDIGLVVKHYTGTNQDDAIVFVCEHILAVQRRGS